MDSEREERLSWLPEGRGSPDLFFDVFWRDLEDLLRPEDFLEPESAERVNQAIAVVREFEAGLYDRGRTYQGRAD